ncbi:MAG TPA: glycosyltransferase family 2 protein [Myxococcota bacterium]|jgi:GT2 family glycosyltransferase
MDFGLPRLPSEAEIAAGIPAIPPVPACEARPFWSVMLPNYQSDAYLARALASVLAQDPGPAAMQIEVIDDASPSGDPQALVEKLGGGRVGFHRHPSNLGATQTFNTCLRRARGRWVHILHADDEVLAGFYAAYQRVIGLREDLVMAVGPVATIDERGARLNAPGPARAGEGRILRDFAKRQATRQQVQFAGWVLRREACERAGGFCTLLHHCADMELAFRLGLLGPVGSVAQAYGCYRIHAGSDSRRLMETGENIREIALAIGINRRRLARARLPAPRRSWRRRIAGVADRYARLLAAAGSTQGSLAQARWALRLWPTPRRARAAASAWLAHARAGRPG